MKKALGKLQSLTSPITSKKSSHSTRNAIFGATLESVLERQGKGTKWPQIVEDCLQYLEANDGKVSKYKNHTRILNDLCLLDTLTKSSTG
jgi:hypothetical protein